MDGWMNEWMDGLNFVCIILSPLVCASFLHSNEDLLVLIIPIRQGSTCFGDHSIPLISSTSTLEEMLIIFKLHSVPPLARRWKYLFHRVILQHHSQLEGNPFLHQSSYYYKIISSFIF
jgi:hypothetical protein